ncbi:VWA domain-containing protein [Saccharothrix variisporea]|uniref:Ca-activated chloride channel family protein n=1 Tax=Saccharothrix variisporea TaxID=543527 RepID=A0A495XLX4_9PSEU|nr:VWA domain-containing protein [Saccharothrix variisporea]RKT74639.1 Ca-activated chloride channel family protein [Saccharothrix variisporea]
MSHRGENMDDVPGFSLAISQNRYLSTEDDEMHAVLTVTAEGLTAAAAPEVAEVIAIDCSGSMAYPPTKIAAAQRATKAAIDALRDGALFAVIEGTHTARVVYPTGPRLVAATPQTRRAAKKAVGRLQASGGTNMGEWLGLARGLLADHPTAVRHVIMLTDGQNNPDDRKLDTELPLCSRVFTCDARGIGADWEKRELLRIAAALHGTADAVRQPADLVADFEAMTKAVMDKVVPEARIVVKTTARAEVDFLRQTFPTDAALVGDRIDARTTAFTTGSWGAESREFHLRLTVDSSDAELDSDIRVGRVDLEVRRPGSMEFESACPPVLVLAHWTDDLKQSSKMDPKVAHYTDQAELGRAVLRGCDAHDANDLVTAAVEWGRAVALATALGNEKVLGRLLRLVEVVGDPSEGVVRLKDDLAAVDLLSVGMSSVMSSMSPDAPPVHPRSPDPKATTAPEITCPNCAKTWPATARFCGACRTPLTA